MLRLYTGNTNNINNALKEISKIVLCKNFSSNCCTCGPDCKFQRRNNIEIKNNNPMEIFILTLHTEQAMQNYKIQKTCIPTRQSDKDMQPKQ